MLTNTVSSQTSTLNPGLALRLQHRLIAVWALAEGTLGGILHGLHIPVTGLVIGSISVCCLALLARVKQRRGDLLKATILVLVIKAMLSPHSPPTAYLAVFSQGLLAEILFSSLSGFKLKNYVFAILTQLQSAIQHLLVVTIVFGMDFWQALDKYLHVISKSLGIEGQSFALQLAVLYVALHLIMGFFIGWVAGNLPNWLPRSTPETSVEISETPALTAKPKTSKFKSKSSLLLIWILLFAVFLQSYFNIGPQVFPQTKVAQILVRSALIGFAWYFLISPLLLKWLHKWLKGQKGPLQNELEAIINLLPETKQIVKQNWQQTADKSGFRRLKQFVKQTSGQLFAFPAELL